ncbi:MAG: hypothetical protein LUC43_01360, partial [Burkholderiales bacterium]|nr:hypothetical protein [Burkholderiales bacterium]
MKRTLLSIGLVWISLGALQNVEAGYYPQETEELCAGVTQEPTEDQLKAAFNCENARNAYLRKQLEEAYKKAYESAEDKEKIEKAWGFEEQAEKDYQTKVVEVEAKDGVTKQLFDDAVERNVILILAVNRYSVMPLSKAIRNNKNPVKLVDTNFNKALAKAKDKTAFRNAQKEWDANSKEICNNSWGWSEYFGD